MPNSDTHEDSIDDTTTTTTATTTDNKFENLPATLKQQQQQPTTSLDNLTPSPLPKDLSELESPAAGSSSRAIHSDPEELKRKIKVRSRFSSAIRKLSRSTRKKEKPLIKASAVADSSQEPVLSSDADDLPESNVLSETDQQKPKLKKKKSLFGLKKSKVTPKKDPQEPIASQTFKALEPLFQDNENEVVVTTERLSPLEDGKSKVQITIKSKKIEKVASTEQVTDKPSSSPSSSPAPPPPSPPLPTSAAATLPSTNPLNTQTTAKANESLDKKKKLKTKVSTQVPQKSTSSSAAAAAVATSSSAQSKSKAEEKIVITQSAKDTPPREKAPAKPSRLAPTVAVGSNTHHPSSHSCKSSGAIRKTATTTRAAIKLVTAAKAKAKPPATGTATDAANAKTTRPGKGSASPSTAEKKESDLMINPQRGHRFPRPLSTDTKEKSHDYPATATPTSSTATASASLPATVTNNSNNQQRQEQQVTSSPPSQATSALQPQQIEIQSASSETTNASLQPVTNRPTKSTVLEPSAINSSVPNKASPQTDDHISIAESVQPSEVSEDLDSVHNTTSKEPSPRQSSFVRFHLGTRVRPPLLANQLAYEPSSQEPYSLEPTSDDSDSANSEDSHRRCIHYISQPSLLEEFNSLELKRTHYRYQSGVSDLSLDSAEHEEVKSIESTSRQMPAFGDLTMDQEIEPTIMTSANTEKREHLYKILVIGELGTGKTSFIKRYVHQFFSQNYRATIGVDFALKVLHWDPNTIIRLQLWDIAGQERFGNMTRVYYKEAVGAFIVFDVTRSGTFDCVSKWKEDLDSKVQLPDGSPIPCILLANKCDQDKQGVVTNTEKMDEYVKEHGFAGWFETSAKENINIDEAARALVNKILLNDKLISASDLADSEKFNLNNTGDQTLNDAKSKCSC